MPNFNKLPAAAAILVISACGELPKDPGACVDKATGETAALVATVIPGQTEMEVAGRTGLCTDIEFTALQSFNDEYGQNLGPNWVRENVVVIAIDDDTTPQNRWYPEHMLAVDGEPGVFTYCFTDGADRYSATVGCGEMINTDPQ